MHFDLILGDDDNQTTKVECHIELTAFDVGYHITPCVTRFNCYQSKNNQWDIVLNKLTMLIDACDELQLDSNMKFPTVKIRDNYLPAEQKLIHEELINPLLSHCINIYKLLNDQHKVDHIDHLVTIFNTLSMFRDVSVDIISNLNHQSFSLRFSNKHTLFTDEDIEHHNMARNAGDIFLSPTAIAYDYDNISTEHYIDNGIEHTAIKMYPHSPWHDDIGQQVSYNGDLLFWCGDNRTHEETVDDINYSLEHTWGNYKIRKTDLSNKWDMLTMGMIKVGRFDIIPDARYNKVVGYVRK